MQRPYTLYPARQDLGIYSDIAMVPQPLGLSADGPGSSDDIWERQIAGMWHITTLQEASEYVDHELLANRFHVTHYAGCAILFNKDTFYPNIAS